MGPTPERPAVRRWPAALLIAGAGVVAWGVFLPWASLFAGLDPLVGARGTNGRILLGGAAIVVTLGIVGAVRGSRAVVLIGAWVSVGVAVFGVVLLANLVGAYRSSDGSMALLRLGPGLFVCVFGAVIAASTLAVGGDAPVGSTTYARAISPFLRIGAGLTLGAGLIHLAVVGEHVREFPIFGWFFLATGLAQLVASAWLWRGAPRSLIVATLALNSVLVGLWAISRTTGLPLGPEPWQPEALGVLDIIATAYELIAVFVLLGSLRRSAGDDVDAVHARLVGLITLLSVGGAVALSLVQLGTFG